VGLGVGGLVSVGVSTGVATAVGVEVATLVGTAVLIAVPIPPMGVGLDAPVTSATASMIDVRFAAPSANR